MDSLKREQFSVLTSPYLHHTLEYALDSAAANGFQKAELYAASPHYCIDDYPDYTAGRERIRTIRRMLQERGLTLSALHPEQHRQYPYNIASPNSHIRQFSVQHMLRYVEDSAELGVFRMILCPGWECLDRKDPDNRKRSVESIQTIGETAQRLGVVLYLEEMAAIHSTFTDRLDKLSGLIRDVGMDNVYPCYDSYMANVNGETWEDYLAEFGSIDYIHLSDCNRDGYVPLGDGRANTGCLLDTLRRQNYKGILSISIWGGGYYKNPDEPLRRSRDYLRASGIVSL